MCLQAALFGLYGSIWGFFVSKGSLINYAVSMLAIISSEIHNNKDLQPGLIVHSIAAAIILVKVSRIVTWVNGKLKLRNKKGKVNEQPRDIDEVSFDMSCLNSESRSTIIKLNQTKLSLPTEL